MNSLGTSRLIFAGLADVHGQPDRAVRLVRGIEAFAIHVCDPEAYRCSPDMSGIYAPLPEKWTGYLAGYPQGEKTRRRPMCFLGENDEKECYMTITAGNQANVHCLGGVAAGDRGLALFVVDGVEARERCS